MTTRDVASVAVKLVGLVVLVRALTLLPSSIEWMAMARLMDEPMQFRFTVVTQLTSLGVAVCIGMFLLIGSGAIVSKLFPDGYRRVPGLDPQELLSVLLAAASQYVAIDALPDVLRRIMFFPLVGRSYGGGMSRENWVPLATEVTRLGLGIALFLGSKYLATLWRRLSPLGPSGE